MYQLTRTALRYNAEIPPDVKLATNKADAFALLTSLLRFDYIWKSIKYNRVPLATKANLKTLFHLYFELCPGTC